jgi:hypothetical protein
MGMETVHEGGDCRRINTTTSILGSRGALGYHRSQRKQFNQDLTEGRREGWTSAINPRRSGTSAINANPTLIAWTPVRITPIFPLSDLVVR